MRTGTTIFAALIALLTLLSGFASGQSAVGVNPVARLFSGQPGQTITQIVTVDNPDATSQKLKVLAYLTDMNILESGEVAYLAPGTLPESLSTWITVTPSEVELGPGESKQVRYTIQIPADAKPGARWAMLMFEGQGGNVTPGRTLAAFRVRVAHTMYVHVQPVTAQGEISGVFDRLPRSNQDMYQIAVQYTNTGNAVVGVQGRIELRDERGNVAATVPLALSVSLPGRSVLLRGALAGPFPKGKYSALVILTNGERNKDIVGEHFVELPFDLVARTAAPAPSPSTPPASAPSGGRP